MIYTQLIAIAIVIAAGTVLFGSGLIDTADQAALALKPAAGPLAFLLFSFGIITSGLLAVPILSSTTAYVVADAFHWHEGLDRPFKEAKQFYHVLILGMLVGIVIAFMSVSPIKMLLYTQVLNGFLMPILIWVVLRMSDDREVVGEHHSTPLIRLFGYLALIIFVVFDSLMIWQWID
jgi:Mn2+/Fe2+ NRAMP family transporter